MAGSEYTKPSAAAAECAAARLLRLSAEAGQSMARLVEALLCAERCLLVLLLGWRQQECVG